MKKFTDFVQPVNESIQNQENDAKLVLEAGKFASLLKEQGVHSFSELSSEQQQNVTETLEGSYSEILEGVKFGKVKVKYKVVNKKTYATDQKGIEFAVEINGIKAKGYWKPTGEYTAKGVDVNELQEDLGYTSSNGRSFTIFSNGGGRRYYEIHGSPEKDAKQPKDLSFTGPYYSTANLGPVFVDYIKKALAGEGSADLSDDFIKFFNLIPISESVVNEGKFSRVSDYVLAARMTLDQSSTLIDMDDTDLRNDVRQISKQLEELHTRLRKKDL